MKRTIRLSDCAHLDCDGGDYLPSHIAAARAALVKRNLRLDNATGTIRDCNGELERFSRQPDHEPHTSLEDVMRWDFQRYIRNGASRIERGFEP